MSKAKPKSSPSSPAKGKDLESFRSAHDRSYIVPKKIQAGLEALGESWEYEAEFIRRCGLSTGDFAVYRDKFQDFSVETASVNGNRGKRVWAGTKAFASKLRAQIQ
jgi:hypothetical protein